MLVLVVSAIVLAGCITIEIDGESLGDTERGSGDLVTEQRTVAAFSAVEVSGALRVELDRGALGIEIEFDDNLIERVETAVRNGEISIRCPDCSPSSHSVIRLSAPDIEAIEVSGASRVRAFDVDEQSLKLSISGASRIEISGQVELLEIDGSGASVVDGPDLRVERLDVNLSGASRAEIRVIERVEGDLSGASHVDLAGNEDPVIDVDTSAGSSIRR